MTTKYQRYIDACREAGLTSDDLISDIEEVVFTAIADSGYGYGAGYTPDAQDEERAWSKAHDIALRIAEHLDED
jgi:hypothetical protein